jgi:hypothetical protein
MAPFLAVTRFGAATAEDVATRAASQRKILPLARLSPKAVIDFDRCGFGLHAAAWIGLGSRHDRD